MTPSTANIAMLSTAGAAAVYLASRALRKPTESKTTTSTELLDPSDCIQPEDVVAVFDDLFLHMQAVLAQLSQQIQQIQMAGQSIPEPQLRQLLKSEFDRALLAKQPGIFDKHDLDEDCVKEATWEFMESPEKFPTVKKAVERFQKLYENVTGEKVVGKKPGSVVAAVNVVDIPKDILLGAVSIYFEAITDSMAAVVNKHKAEGMSMDDPSVAQKVQMEFAAVVNDAGEAALEKEGITLDSFKAAIDKYSSDPDVGRALAMLQMKQQQELMALGVKM